MLTYLVFGCISFEISLAMDPSKRWLFCSIFNSITVNLSGILITIFAWPSDLFPKKNTPVIWVFFFFFFEVWVIFMFSLLSDNESSRFKDYDGFGCWRTDRNSKAVSFDLSLWLVINQQLGSHFTYAVGCRFSFLYLILFNDSKFSNANVQFECPSRSSALQLKVMSLPFSS